ncbi:MAG TPA: hypothetical protein VK425_06815, partial [Acidimicrobiales bacterium]|nr:hypothetical protein [Acidimicrobiales bacterium]
WSVLVCAGLCGWLRVGCGWVRLRVRLRGAVAGWLRARRVAGSWGLGQSWGARAFGRLARVWVPGRSWAGPLWAPGTLWRVANPAGC